MTILGERTEELDIFCCVTGFTSDFLSFIDVELIWFFHGALQLVGVTWLLSAACYMTTVVEVITCACIGFNDAACNQHGDVEVIVLESGERHA